MKNIKRSLTLLLITAMILSSINMIYADTTTTKFTDINNSWAKQSIINVSNKGLMNGITPTEFKPLDKVTHYQALVSIARMTKAKEKYDLTALETKYKADVLDKNNVPAYARKEVAYAIEAGIIKATDVAGFSIEPYINKQVVTYNLARAFGASYEAQATFVFLGYKDSMYIRSEYKPYVRYLVDLGVISSAGDEKGNFNPTTQITREVFAKMLDIASDKYNALKPVTTPTPAPTTPAVPTTPAIPTTPAAPAVPETPTTNTDAVPTEPAVIVPKADYIGTVDQVIIEFGTMVFQIPDGNNKVEKKSFKMADDITCVIDGVESAYYWKIKSGDKVFIYLNKEGKVSKLVVDSKIKKYTGTIQSLLITDKLELTVKLQDSTIKKYYITDTTKIIKNKSTVKYDSLKAGDKISMTAAEAEALEINADSIIGTDTGVIESILYTRTSAPKVTMIGADGKNKEYFIRKDLSTANILINDKGSSVYDLRPGMQVKVNLENDEITKLTTIKVETSSKMDGVIKFINKDFKVIVLSQFGADGKEITKEIYVSDCEIRNIRLEELSLDKLKEGDNVTVFAVADTGKLKASLIILNN